MPPRFSFDLIAGLALFCLSIANTALAEKDSQIKANSDKTAAKSPQSGNPKEAAADKPKVKSLGDHRYQLGDIIFNGKTREIRFPATMNLEKGLLEYVLVTEEGKMHESLLGTKVRPAQLQIVLKLCHYRDGVGDTFDALYPDDEKKGAAG
ncbi:MAG: hypothetical protein GXP30_00950, partial [Verrucomicrobia bacterium]|nr:hypothetical protein [Verrucomicrobiota bacterium]